MATICLRKKPLFMQMTFNTCVEKEQNTYYHAVFYDEEGRERCMENVCRHKIYQTFYDENAKTTCILHRDKATGIIRASTYYAENAACFRSFYANGALATLQCDLNNATHGVMTTFQENGDVNDKIYYLNGEEMRQADWWLNVNRQDILDCRFGKVLRNLLPWTKNTNERYAQILGLPEKIFTQHPV